MNTAPKVSICVPVYNVEAYLPRFLDSALCQTFDDYEIILVDNHSTDGSMRILEQYRDAFPDKIFVYQTDIHSGAGKGRNLAFQRSRGEYIYWCDADDMLHPNGIERLYKAAIEHDADLVRACGFKMFEADGEILSISPFLMRNAMDAAPEELIKAGTFFWLDLFKRELVEQVGPMPEDYIYEDIRYLSVIHSYAKSGYFLGLPVYYWSRNKSSTTLTANKKLCEDNIEAEKYALGHVAPEHLDAMQYTAARRTTIHWQEYWPYFDLYIAWTREQSAWFYDNEQIRADKNLFGSLRWADSLADIQFPNIIYVDGFAAAPGEERLAELREKVFHDGCQIVVLSPESCDVNENEYVKRAYEQGDMALVTGYFALKNIYENGGVFIHDNIRILSYFGYLKYQNAFFSLLDKTTYSEWIYGAPAGNEAIGAILKTYSDAWDKKGEYMPLSQRISIVLTGKYGIPLDGQQRWFGEVVSVLPPQLTVADTRFGDVYKRCAFEHDFSARAGEPEYITLPRTSLQALVAPASAGKSARERALERELAEMKKTNTYKLMMKIRTVGDGPCGPFLKRIFHWVLRVRKRYSHE